MSDSSLIYDILGTIRMAEWSDQRSGTNAALCLLTQIVKECEDFHVIEPWLLAADKCVRLLECHGSTGRTHVAAAKFLKHLVYKCYEYKTICLKKGLFSKFCALLNEHKAQEVLLNLSRITSCVMGYMQVSEMCCISIKTDDVLLVIRALQHQGSSNVGIVYNYLRTIRYMLARNKVALESGYVRALTKQSLLIYSTMYLSRRYMQMEILQLVILLNRDHKPSPASSSLDSGIVEQLVIIVNQHAMSTCILSLICETACSFLCSDDGITFIVFSSLPAALAKAHHRRIEEGIRIQSEQRDAMRRLYHNILQKHNPSSAQCALLQYRSLLHLLSSSNCSKYEVQAVFQTIRTV